MKSRSQIAIDARMKRVRRTIDEKDLISKLPDEVLHMTLSRLSTAEAVRTSVLSSRWVDLWKWRPTLELDLRKDLEFERPTITYPLHEVSQDLACPSTKVINNHRGDLESCSIHHYIPQCNDNTLKFVIHVMTRLKKAKELTLVNYPRRRYNNCDMFRMDPNTFSYPNLNSLTLCGYRIVGPRSFENCSNLKTLKLINITISRASKVTDVLAACSSLEVIVLELHNDLYVCDVLKIENSNLKLLQVTFHDKIDRFEVDAANLDVLDIRFIQCESDYDFVLETPNLLFNKNYWNNRGFPDPHMSYNISYLAQEKRSVWHELMVSGFSNKRRRHGSLSVCVDLTNPKEVEILKEVLLMWTTEEMEELEIVFKRNNDHIEAGESSISGDRAHTELWNDTKPFPFGVQSVWLYNFDSTIREEFALVSQFVTQKMVTMRIMVKASNFPLMKKLKVQADMAKLRQESKRLGTKGLTIMCF